MKYAPPRVVDIDLLPPYTDALMPARFFEEFRANIHRSMVLKNRRRDLPT